MEIIIILLSAVLGGVTALSVHNYKVLKSVEGKLNSLAEEIGVVSTTDRGFLEWAPLPFGTWGSVVRIVQKTKK